MRSRMPPAGVVRGIELVRDQVARLYWRMMPAPVSLMEMIFGMWFAQAITVAADLGIADALADGPRGGMSADELAALVDVDAEALARLLRALIGRGVFRRHRDGRYDLNPLAEPLRRDSEVSVAAFARWLGSPEHREHWSHLTGAIRTGRSVIDELRGKSIFDYLAAEPALGEIYDQAMISGSELSIAPVIAAFDFSNYATIVDVGGGRGRLLAAILGATPRSRGILFDLPRVVAGAPALLSQYRVEDRVRIAEGSFFDDVPAGGDAYVLKNVIHDWPDDDALRILGNVRKAAGVGKHVVLVELVIPRHNRQHVAQWMDLEMLLLVSARERTTDEYRRLLSEAGFRLTRVVPTASPFSVIEAVGI